MMQILKMCNVRLHLTRCYTGQQICLKQEHQMVADEKDLCIHFKVEIRFKRGCVCVWVMADRYPSSRYVPLGKVTHPQTTGSRVWGTCKYLHNPN